MGSFTKYATHFNRCPTCTRILEACLCGITCYKGVRKATYGEYRRDKCDTCGRTKHLAVHHWIPLGRGGTNEQENLLTLCKECHLIAHCNHPRYMT